MLIFHTWFSSYSEKVKRAMVHFLFTND